LGCAPCVRQVDPNDGPGAAATDPVDDSRAAEIVALLVGASGEEDWVEWDYRHIRAVAGDPRWLPVASIASTRLHPSGSGMPPMTWRTSTLPSRESVSDVGKPSSENGLGAIDAAWPAVE
jgi:hypothetical protein